jgi:hypothetical protein
MVLPRFWWLDDTDRADSNSKLEVAKGQLHGWDWVRFCEDDHEDLDEARKSLVRHIGIPSMFGDGKVVYSYGVPFYRDKVTQTKLAKEIEVPDGVMFLIIAPIEDCPLLSKAKEMQAAKLCKITTAKAVNKAELCEWIKQTVIGLGGGIDDASCAMLVEAVGADKNRLHKEIEKLVLVAPNGNIASWVVEQACSDNSESSTRQLTDSIMRGDGARAHEYMRRLLKGTPRDAILQALVSWLRGLAMADSCDMRLDENYDKIAGITKGDGSPLVSSGAIRYAFSTRRRPGWAIRAIREIRRAQIETRIRKPFRPPMWGRPLMPFYDAPEQRMHLLLCEIMNQGGENGQG